jgi:uncharacterized protein
VTTRQTHDRSALRLPLSEVTTATLEDIGPPKGVYEGLPVRSSRRLFESAGAIAGMWSATRGAWRATYENHECFVVVAGSATLESDAGEVMEVAEGDVCVVPAGWTGTWTVQETIRKFFLTAVPTDERPGA